MEKVIELFVSFEIAFAGGSMSGKIPAMTRGGVRCQKNFAELRRATHSFSGYDDKEKKVQELLDRISKTHDVEIIKYDTTKRRGRKIAKKKGITETPSVIIGDKILTGYVHEIDILKALGIPVENTELKWGKCPDCNSSNIELFRDSSGHCMDCGSSFMEAK